MRFKVSRRLGELSPQTTLPNPVQLNEVAGNSGNRIQ